MDHTDAVVAEEGAITATERAERIVFGTSPIAKS